MRYLDYKSFSVSSSGRSPDVCAKNGHAEPDRRGRCFMCGEPVTLMALAKGKPEWGTEINAAPIASRCMTGADFDRIVKGLIEGSVPSGEVHVQQGGQTVAKIVNVAQGGEAP